MTEALVLVVDASVVVKWHLRDEEFVDLALRVLQDYQDGRIDLLAPDHVRYEVPNAIRVAVSRSRLSFVEGTGAVNDFDRPLELRRFDTNDLPPRRPEYSTAATER